jgi:hypothetical protein
MFEYTNEYETPESRFKFDPAKEIKKYKVLDVKLKITELQSQIETLDSFNSEFLM